jgi:nitrite reductase (NADH) small subunit
MMMRKVAVTNIADIKELRSKVIHVDGIEVAVFKLSNGEIYAIENSCPHKQGKLSEGIVCNDHVYCPLHDWKISVKDGLVQDPDEGCVRSFATEVDKESGQISILLTKKAAV